MTFEAYPAASLLRPFNEVPHLFVIMNERCKDGLCLSVMITSIKKNRFYDDACVLDVGDHEFITHPSYLLYRLAETDLAIHLSNMVQKRFYLQKQDFRPEVYDRIVDGLRISDELPSRVIAYAESRMII